MAISAEGNLRGPGISETRTAITKWIMPTLHF